MINCFKNFPLIRLSCVKTFYKYKLYFTNPNIFLDKSKIYFKFASKIENDPKNYFFILILNQFLYGQEGYTISGVVTSQGDPVPYANVYLETTSFGTISNVEGYYEIKNVPENVYML